MSIKSDTLEINSYDLVSSSDVSGVVAKVQEV